MGLLDDGSTVSWNYANHGRLEGAVKLPLNGVGYYVPQRWASRGLNWGTDEMIALIQFAGRQMSVHGKFAVGDIALKHGGPSAWHRSHQTGRDVDLVMYAKRKTGEPVESRSMHRFDENGKGPGDLIFDVERNWLLVKALIYNPVARVQYIFVSEELKQHLLDFARASGEHKDTIALAEYLLRQPSDSSPHADHFHVRIMCATSDMAVGCKDYGDLGWRKKHDKYDRLLPKRAPGRLVASNE